MVNGNVHSLVRGSRGPVRTVVLCFLTAHVSAVKVTVYPASQRRLVEMREAVVRPGTTWAVIASGDKPGKFSVAMCVDRSVFPSGRVTVMGAGSGRLFSTGAVSVTKWLVAPESLMANGVGGVGTVVVSSSSQSS